MNNIRRKPTMPPKKLVFYLVLCGISSLPLMFFIFLFWISSLTHDVLRNPAQHKGSDAFWSQAATAIYYAYEANIWQAQQECARYDEVLLYVPSNGCVFKNREFSTTLNFSDAKGRYIGVQLDPTAKSNPPLLVLGDSITMGWGVNDSEAFPSIIASRTKVPVLNLGVGSYGTVRELIRGRMNMRFADSKCIIIQYENNDFEENITFLRDGALPVPTKERFQRLLDYKPRELSFPELSLRVFQYALFGQFPGAGLGESPTDSALHADVFLKVVARFEEYAQKTIFVWGGRGGFIETLLEDRYRPKNIIPIEMSPFINYTLDNHPNQAGHRRIAEQLLKEIGMHKSGRRCIEGS
jgi:hypothetical protein